MDEEVLDVSVPLTPIEGFIVRKALKKFAKLSVLKSQETIALRILAKMEAE